MLMECIVDYPGGKIRDIKYLHKKGKHAETACIVPEGALALEDVSEGAKGIHEACILILFKGCSGIIVIKIGQDQHKTCAPVAVNKISEKIFIV